MQIEQNQIHLLDCIEGMRLLEPESVNLIIADPPYNLGKDFGVWKEEEKKGVWLDWSKKWLNEAERVLITGGSIFVYGIHHHLCWLQCHMYDIGLDYRRQIIWNYENGFAGYSKKTLAAQYEPILWFSKGDDYIYHPIREPYKSKERLKYKIIKNGKVWRPNPKGKLGGDVWRFPTLAGKRFSDEKVDHPTQKPLSITKRIVEHFSNPEGLVLVPFAGSGTECLASAMLGRHFMGFDNNPDYVELANSRLSDWSRSQQLSIFHSQTYPDTRPDSDPIPSQGSPQ